MGSPDGAPLLPKLRGQLAEFLDEGSPVPLGALAPGHQCRSAVRARAASRAGLFLGASPDRLGPPRGGPRPSLGTPCGAPAELDAASPARRSALPAPSPARTLPSARGDGISTVCPSATPFGLALGPTHPPRMDLAEETSAIRGVRFSRTLRYSCRHSHSPALQPTFRSTFTARGTLPYRSVLTDESRSFGAGLSPGHCRRARTRPVSCYALFEGWLLLSQPPGCLGARTSFATEPGLRDLS